jgi:Cu2+-exporting ATPase
MRENLWLAALYNLLAVPLAVFGVLTPLLAAAGMSGSSLLVTLNALRARDIDEHSIKQSRKSRRSQPQISAPLTAGVGT